MTHQPREHRDALANDRRIERGHCGHGSNCRCLRNVGRDLYVAATETLKAENDRLGRPSPPLGQWMRRPGA